MRRRTVLKLAAAWPALTILPRVARTALADDRRFQPQPGTWRNWKISTKVEIQRGDGEARVWVPLPGLTTPYQQPVNDRWSGNARRLLRRDDPRTGLSLLYAEFAADGPAPLLEIETKIRTQDRAVDWNTPRPAALINTELKRWVAGSQLAPIDGIVAETARRVAGTARTDRDKVAAVYDWVLATMWRDTAVRGCGVGDAKTILETRRFGGKCADLNGVFVAMVRALEIPARDLYGLRVGPSAFGYQALGPSTTTVTKAQHCRAEVFLRDHGWVAMDPADVAKVAREETSSWLGADDAIVTTIRPKLFGGWDGNWIAYNAAHDVVLPNAVHGETVGFLMYPQGETRAGRVDPLAPDDFKYAITAEAATA